MRADVKTRIRTEPDVQLFRGAKYEQCYVRKQPLPNATENKKSFVSRRHFLEVEIRLDRAIFT